MSKTNVKARDAPGKDSGRKPNSEAKHAKGLSGKLVALILGVVLILSAAAVVTLLLLKDNTPAEPQNVSSIGSGSVFVDDSNIAAVEEQLREKAAKSMFTTHMNTIWTFPDGKSASIDAVMGNSSSNNYPFWFDVKVDDEVVYKSSLIPVGSQVKEIVLSKDLDPGTYPAVITVNMVDENNEPVESNMGFNINLVIQS